MSTLLRSFPKRLFTKPGNAVNCALHALTGTTPPTYTTALRRQTAMANSKRNMIREDTVFGPIHSRRLGASLGVNLLPKNGKICTFDCIYCECGWNKDGKGDTLLPRREDVKNALESKLISLSDSGTHIDSITFSGDGEPTINPHFPEIIDDTIALRNRYFPNAKVSVLSNASRVHIPKVFEALKKVDKAIMKIDAPTDHLISLINRHAPGYSLKRVISALEKFDGAFVLQTMFLRSPFFDSSDEKVLNGWKDIVRQLNPQEIMVYTIDRPTPEERLEKFTAEQMYSLVEDLIKEGYNIQISG